MYTLKRSEKIIEQIQIGGEIIDINLDIIQIAAQFQKSYNALSAAQLEFTKAKTYGLDTIDSAFEKYGSAVTAVLNIVFGEENTKNVVAFYDNNYAEMITEIFPFIITVIMPKIKEVAKRRTDEIEAVYKNSKKK